MSRLLCTYPTSSHKLGLSMRQINLAIRWLYSLPKYAGRGAISYDGINADGLAVFIVLDTYETVTMSLNHVYRIAG
jgi:hypothetical protein